MNKNRAESLQLLPFCSLSTAVSEVGLPFTATGAGDTREVSLPAPAAQHRSGCARAIARISTTPEQPPGKTRVPQVVSSWMHLPSVKQGDVSGATRSVSRLLGAGLRDLSKVTAAIPRRLREQNLPQGLQALVFWIC